MLQMDRNSDVYLLEFQNGRQCVIDDRYVPGFRDTFNDKTNYDDNVRNISKL